MIISLHTPMYDPALSYELNYRNGPFGAFSDTTALRRTGTPSADFLGHPVWQPFGIPAGPLLNADYIEAAFRKGFDICVYKTVRTTTKPAHPAPNILAVHVPHDLREWHADEHLLADDAFTEPPTICNSFGVPSQAPEIWQPDMERAVRSAGSGQLLIGSFQGTTRAGQTHDDYVADCAAAARLAVEAGAPMLELDASCPNEGVGSLLCYDAGTLAEVCAAVRAAVGDVPFGIKISAFRDDALLRKVLDAIAPFASFVSAINTLPATLVDRDDHPALPGEGREVGGVCGAAILHASIDMVSRVRRHLDDAKGKMAIVGVGGVHDLATHDALLEAGADAVMSATGAMWDADLARQIWDGHKQH